MVIGCVASSKTMAAAMAVLWWLSAYQPARAFTIAPSHRQVKANLWGELRALYHAARAPLGGDLLPQSPELRIGPNWYAVGFATDEPSLIHGIHGDNDLIVVDDAHGLEQPMWDAIENAMAGGNSRLLALANPVVLSGQVYDAAHGRRDIWQVKRIRAQDTPNFTHGRIVIPGMITPAQAEEWRLSYGEDSDFYRVKVLAEFPKQEADTLIPLSWIELAMTRQVPADDTAKTILGVDVARFGDDRTVIQPLRGREVLPPIVIKHADTMHVAGRVSLAAVELKASWIFVDETGIGAGVKDRLMELRLPVRGVNSASKPSDQRHFHTLRSELWWRAREATNPNGAAPVSLPRDQELVAELSGVKYRLDSSGRIRVEPKEDMKSRLGKSPDKADALCLALLGSRIGSIQAKPYIPQWVSYPT